jgi:glc operon protein GlcG
MAITLKEAREICEAMVTYVTEDRFVSLKEPGVPFSVAVVDAAGALVSLDRMDGSPPLTARVAVNKATTAIDWRMDTKAIRERLFAGKGPLAADINRDMAWFGDPNAAPIPGGVLLRELNGTIAGAVGTSGRTAEEDEELARIGARVYQDILKQKTGK